MSSMNKICLALFGYFAFILLLMALSARAHAVPVITTYTTLQPVTHCGVYVDGDPVYKVKTNHGACKIPLNNLSKGTHAIRLTFFLNGVESPKSASIIIKDGVKSGYIETQVDPGPHKVEIPANLAIFDAY